MKKLISILLIIGLVFCGGEFATVFAQEASEKLCDISIRPKHKELLPGSDDFYYGYIEIKEKITQDNISYTAKAKSDEDKVRIEITTEGNGKRNIQKKEVDLKEGENKFEIEAGGKLYNIKIYREVNPLEKNSLKLLEIIDNINRKIELTPKFDPNTLKYSAKVSNDISKINITTVDMCNQLYNNEYSLKTGENIIELKALSQMGNAKVYTVNVYREKSTDTTFKSMKISQYNAKKAKLRSNEIWHSNNSSEYKLDVTYDVTQISVNLSYGQTQNVTGEGTYKLKVGSNKIKLGVISEAGNEKNYYLIVNRSKPSTELSEIYINGIICAADQGEVSLDVDYSTTTAKISAVQKDKTAVVKGNGTYKLKAGKNKFVITVKAVDGKIKSYPIVITRTQKPKVKVQIIIEE